ncbi:unnamed protein product [Tuber aestivum]|uniref:Uncharacterized protein n=1 Tax=Tuber aestivum TaxID=59557 RepID=A0A292PXJ6_9PEZI|nr:unnamed protein product [Tuber aestivum]
MGRGGSGLHRRPHPPWNWKRDENRTFKEKQPTPFYLANPPSTPPPTTNTMAPTSGISKDPQKQSKAPALDPKGKKATPAHGRRAGTKTGPPPLSPESQNDTEHADRIVTTPGIGDEVGMRPVAEHEVRQILPKVGHHTALEEGDSATRRPRRGHPADMPARIEALTELFQSFDKDIMSIRAHQASLEHRVRDLTFCQDYYKPLRNRFISTFKRDILDTATPADLEIIGEGNLCADCGDAIADARLYTDGERIDLTTFTRLYGLLPYVVPKIRHQETMTMINMHATIIASKEKTVTDKFHRLFEQFVKVFTEYGEGFEQGYLKGDPTEVTHAYREFANCIKTEVGGEAEDSN